MSKTARYLVSQNKLRTVNKHVPSGSVDLDLTEIHPSIVCMGYPASGVEALYRNKYEDAVRYLDFKYGDSYIVYNLCQEKAYQYSCDKFHGRIRCFPFLDHHPPPLAMLAGFVDDASANLSAHRGAVVVIHCKAGKGRTGIMACCLLMAIEPSLAQSAASAMAYYGRKRTSDGRGLTVPGQRRAVEYYERILKEYGGKVPAAETAPVSVREIRLVGFAKLVSLRCIRIYVNNGSASSDTHVEVKLKDGMSSQSKVQCVTTYCVTASGVRADVYTLRCEAESRLQGMCGDVRLELHSSRGCAGTLFFHTLFMKQRYEGVEIDKLAKLCSVNDECAIEFDLL